jgi:hypothetical protein
MHVLVGDIPQRATPFALKIRNPHDAGISYGVSEN